MGLVFTLLAYIEDSAHDRFLKLAHFNPSVFFCIPSKHNVFLFLSSFQSTLIMSSQHQLSGNRSAEWDDQEITTPDELSDFYAPEQQPEPEYVDSAPYDPDVLHRFHTPFLSDNPEHLSTSYAIDNASSSRGSPHVSSQVSTGLHINPSLLADGYNSSESGLNNSLLNSGMPTLKPFNGSQFDWSPFHANPAPFSNVYSTSPLSYGSQQLDPSLRYANPAPFANDYSSSTLDTWTPYPGSFESTPLPNGSQRFNPSSGYANPAPFTNVYSSSLPSTGSQQLDPSLHYANPVSFNGQSYPYLLPNSFGEQYYDNASAMPTTTTNQALRLPNGAVSQTAQPLQFQHFQPRYQRRY